MNYKVAVIPGDGIGPEIVREARKRPEGNTYFYVRRRMSRLGKVLRVASN